MTALREAAQQVLEALERYQVKRQDFDRFADEITALRAALKQEEEASAWLSERKEHWRKEREKMQATKDQDPELSAALGWPGGTSDPVLDRTRLLQMVAALRLASQQALEALGLAKLNGKAGLYPAETEEIADAITALRAALAQQDEPVQEPAYKVKATSRWHDTEPLAAAFNLPDGEHLLYATPPQRLPLTEEVATLTAQRDALLEACKLALEQISPNYYRTRDTIRAAIKAVEEGK